MKNNTKRQSDRGTLKVVAGVNTKRTLREFHITVGMGERKSVAKPYGPDINPEGLLRMARRQTQTFEEDMGLVLLIAKKTGELEWDPTTRHHWRFRGIVFSEYCLSEKLKRMMLRRFTVEEYRIYVVPDARN